jgi:4-hydroxy-tetrahydrodipicolinate synthase
VASHLVGPSIQSMITSYFNGDHAAAAVAHRKLMPVFKGLFNCPHRVPNPVPVKHALQLSGMPVGGVRLPLVGPTEQEASFIQNLLASVE